MREEVAVFSGNAAVVPVPTDLEGLRYYFSYFRYCRKGAEFCTILFHNHQHSHTPLVHARSADARCLVEGGWGAGSCYLNDLLIPGRIPHPFLFSEKVLELLIHGVFC